MVALAGELGQQAGVLGVALDKAVASVIVEAPPDRSVLAEVVDADDLVSGLKKVGDEVAADEAGRAGDEDFQRRMGPVMPQMSTTSRPSSSNAR